MGWKRIGLMRRPVAGGEARSRASFFIVQEKACFLPSIIQRTGAFRQEVPGGYSFAILHQEKELEAEIVRKIVRNYGCFLLNNFL